MGMPEIIIEFKSKASAAIKSGTRGVVALILKDSTKNFESKEYGSFDDVSSSDWTVKSYDFIKQAFLGGPSKVIVERIAPADEQYAQGLKRLKTKRWNWLAVPEMDSAGADEVKIFIENLRDKNKAIFKAVIANCDADNEGIVNFVAADITTSSKTYTAAEYTPRIAGILAGLPTTQSATYHVLAEVTSIAESEDPDADIEAGRLILVNDGASIKLGRAVTSCTSSPELTKIKIVEGMDIIKNDIRETFNSHYVGKVLNTYDNKIMFLAAINSYLQELAGSGVLDPSHDNRVEIDIAAQRQFLAGRYVAVDTLSEAQIKEYNTESYVFIGGSVKFADSMEDLKLILEM